MRRENPITISSIILATLSSFRKPRARKIRTISANYCYALFHSRIFHYLQKTIINFSIFFPSSRWGGKYSKDDREKKAAGRERYRHLLSKIFYSSFFFYAEYTRREKKIPPIAIGIND